MNYEKGTVLCSKLSFGAVCEGAAEGEMILPDYCPPIMKIVKSSVLPTIRSKNFYGDKLVAEGTAVFRVVYLSEDGRVCSVSTSVPFSATCRWEGEENDLRAFCGVEYFDVRALSPQKIHCKATVSVRAETFASSGQTALFSKEGPEDTELRCRDAVCCRKTAFGQKNISVSDEIAVENRPSPAELLDYTLDFIPGEEKLLDQKAVVKGEMAVRIIYRSEENTVEVLEHRVPLSQVIDAAGLDETCLCSVCFSPCEFSLSLKDDEDIFVFEGVVLAEISGWKNENYRVVTDAFSPARNLETKNGRISAETAIFENETITFNEKISLPASKIHSIVPRAKITRTSLGEGGEGTVSGVFVCSVFYEDMEGVFSGCDKEIPFTMRAPVGENVTALRGDLSMGVASSAFLCPDSSSAELRINCVVRGLLFATEDQTIVAEISDMGERAAENGPNAVLYFACEGETLWDIAKSFAVPPEKIAGENSLSCDVFSSDTRIIITKGC